MYQISVNYSLYQIVDTVYSYSILRPQSCYYVICTLLDKKCIMICVFKLARKQVFVTFQINTYIFNVEDDLYCTILSKHILRCFWEGVDKKNCSADTEKKVHFSIIFQCALYLDRLRMIQKWRNNKIKTKYTHNFTFQNIIRAA